MTDKLFIGDYPRAELEGKVALVRVDYNVPLVQDGDTCVVAHDARIRDSLVTIQYLLGGNAKVVVMSHLGRPKSPSKECSLEPVARRLQELIPDSQVDFCPDCVGDEALTRIAQMKLNSVLVLENLRFHCEETLDDHIFARNLAEGKDLYINDAFSACHREHASVHAIANYFGAIYCGFALRKELQYLQEAIIENPKRPIAAVIGGVKVSTKLHLFENLLTKVDILCIGGAMVYTFYRALGHDVGDSLVEESMVEHAAHILRKASSVDTVFRLATDMVIASSQQLKTAASIQSSDLTTQIVQYDAIPHGWQGLDIGKESIRNFAQELYRCQTIVWNGPMGKCEDPAFAQGTNELIRILTECTQQKMTTIACGGDTVSAIENVPDAMFSHLSMGGGAALELLSGNVLPGVEVLSVRVDSVTRTDQKEGGEIDP